ncbi:MAG: hypothetical protein WBC06_17200 [Chitinophagaceae bacterium]
MNRLFLLTIMAFFSLATSAQEWKLFSDTSIAFTAQYPSTWTNKIKENKRVFFTSPAENDKDAFFENVNISMTRNAAYGTEIKINDVIPAVLNELTNTIDNFAKTTERYFKWNNNDACELIYTGQPKNSDLKVKITQRFCFSEGRLFTATYTSLVSNTVSIQTALKILNSIIFK